MAVISPRTDCRAIDASRLIQSRAWPSVCCGAGLCHVIGAGSCSGAPGPATAATAFSTASASTSTSAYFHPRLHHRLHRLLLHPHSSTPPQSPPPSQPPRRRHLRPVTAGRGTSGRSPHDPRVLCKCLAGNSCRVAARRAGPAGWGARTAGARGGRGSSPTCPAGGRTALDL